MKLRLDPQTVRMRAIEGALVARFALAPGDEVYTLWATDHRTISLGQGVSVSVHLILRGNEVHLSDDKAGNVTVRRDLLELIANIAFNMLVYESVEAPSAVDQLAVLGRSS